MGRAIIRGKNPVVTDSKGPLTLILTVDITLIINITLTHLRIR